MSARSDAPGPLDGVLVADFSRVLAGPYAAMTLGDLGAEVIKVERPGTGDDTRAWGPPWFGDQSTYFLGLNRNKRSVRLDLGDPGDAVLARRLAVRADVLIENFRPGTMERYGLGHAELSAVNEGLVYCSVTGFGADPAAADLPGYDLVVQASSGLMSITGEPGGEPLKVGVALVDHICALQATIGILAALRHRDRTGRGQHVSVSLMGAALAALLNQASAYLGAGVVPGRLGNRHPSIAPYQTFRASDGHVVVACGNDTQFAKACAVLELADLPADERFATNTARVANIGALDDLMSARLERAPAATWVSALTAAGVPAGPINDIAAAFTLAGSLGISAVDRSTAGGPPTVASPIVLSETPATTRIDPPRLGEHDDEIRRWLATE
jgi:crotonobetainyl-CoA:carnitine CoA-transferase CaiB-like acyl-CoA transferase